MISDKVAVLLSTYNGEKYIVPQIESILNQDTDCEITLYVRDDGSKDSTIDILERIQKNDARVVLIKGENCGGNSSFFELIKIAATLPGEYKFFALSDQDDVWDRDKLSTGINAIRNSDCEGPILYGCVTRPVDENLNIIPRKRRTERPISFYNTIIQNFIAGHTHVMNRELLNLICEANPSELYGHDSFIVNVAILGGVIIFDNTPHASYRQHNSNQLGTSNYNLFSWAIQRIKRIKKGDSVKYAKQIEYIAGYCDPIMSEEQKAELNSFLRGRATFLSKIKYLKSKKIYRQEKFDDFAFCLLYLFGGYDT